MRILLSALALFLCVVRPVQGSQNLDGAWEGEIQDPKRPIVITVDFTNLKMTGSITANVSRLVTVDESKSLTFEANSGNQTLRFDGNRDAGRIVGEVDTGNRKIPFWLELLPTLPEPANRTESWQQDIDVVASRFLRYDRSFSAAQRRTVRQRLQSLRKRIDHLSGQAIMVELARAIAMSGNAHTRLYLMRNRTEVRRVPLRVWWFGKELRVIRASNAHLELVGCRVTKFGTLDSFAAFQKIRGIKAGNESWQRYMSSYFLTSPDVLFGASVISNPDKLPLTLNCNNRTRRVNIAPLPLRKASTPVEAWWDLSPAYRNLDVELNSAPPSEEAPLYLQHPDRNYWVEYLAEPAIIYLQYNRSQEMASEPMDDFIRRVVPILDEHPVKGLIVDVRFNTGGDAGVGTPLVDALAPRLKSKPVVVLTGRATFSAGISHTAQWKQIASASIVGEPIGDNLDLWSEGGNLVLPNSKLTVHYANGFHRYSQRDYPAFKPYFAELKVATLAPDVLIEPSWSQYAAGSDPVLSAAVALISKR